MSSERAIPRSHARPRAYAERHFTHIAIMQHNAQVVNIIAVYMCRDRVARHRVDEHRHSIGEPPTIIPVPDVNLSMAPSDPSAASCRRPMLLYAISSS